MKKFKIIIFFFLIIFFINTVKAIEIVNLASINNKVITNVDLANEIKIREIVDKLQITKNDHAFILQQMINDKIKKIETDNNKIQISKNLVDKQYQLIKKTKFDQGKISKELKNVVILKIENSLKWNRLIKLMYGNKMAININEIEDIIKSNNIPDNQKEKIVQIERNKKLNTFSKTHFNKIKKKYLIKIY